MPHVRFFNAIGCQVEAHISLVSISHSGAIGSGCDDDFLVELQSVVNTGFPLFIPNVLNVIMLIERLDSVA